MAYKNVTHLSPYVPRDSNLRGYYLDFTVEGEKPERIKDMPFAQMQVLISMAMRNRLMYDVDAKHFNIAGDGKISDWSG